MSSCFRISDPYLDLLCAHNESDVCAFVDYVYDVVICCFVKLSMLSISGINPMLNYQVPICDYAF